jgi:hypothetical protein
MSERVQLGPREHRLWELTWLGLPLRVFNVLHREGILTVEELLGTDSHRNVVAQGPEPLPWRPYDRKKGFPRQPPGRDTWQRYRSRPSWLDYRGIGVGAVVAIAIALKEWQRTNRRNFWSPPDEDDEQ